MCSALMSIPLPAYRILLERKVEMKQQRALNSQQCAFVGTASYTKINPHKNAISNILALVKSIGTRCQHE
jgi:hypothetical protein